MFRRISFIISIAAIGYLDYFLGNFHDGTMAILPLAAILAAVGLLKSQTIDKQQEAQQRKMRATEQALSPFTGLAAQTQIKPADPFGQTLAFGTAGRSLEEQIAGSEAAKQAAESQAKILESMAAGQKSLAEAQAEALRARYSGNNHALNDNPMNAWESLRMQDINKYPQLGG